MISRDTIERVFQEVRIEDVVGEFVPLKKAGSSYKGLSPFSKEKTPSFFVSPSKGIFKDFSSGKGGNAVTFLMEIESMTFPEAIRYIAAKYGIEVEETGEDRPAGEEVSLRESLALVNQFAFEHFEHNLWETDEGRQIGLSYFRERQFTDPTIRKFGLGYGFEQKDALLKTALDAGHNQDHLLRLGLVKEGSFGHYDFFRDRVIFPIRNVSGRTIGFAGRTLRSDNKVKYLNSPESELYEKSKVLYGLFEGKRSIMARNMCFLVEGYTDVISLHQAGVEYAVASSGTSLTDDQVKLIKRYTANVTVLYDGDSAGVKAAMRGIDMLLKEGMQVKVVLFPDGHDPDSYARSVTQEELEKYLKVASKDFVDFFIEILLPQGPDTDPIEKTAALRRMVESLALIDDQIGRSMYVEKCSRLLNIAAQVLHTEINKLLRQAQRKRSLGLEATQEVPTTPDLQVSLPPQMQQNLEQVSEQGKEVELVRILLQYGNIKVMPEQESEQPETPPAEGEEAVEGEEVALILLGELMRDGIHLQNPLLQRIVDQFVTYYDTNGYFPSLTEFSHDLDLSQLIADIIASPHELSESWETKHSIYTELEKDFLERAALAPVYHYKLHLLKKLMRDNRERLKEPLDKEEINELLMESMRLKHIQRSLCEILSIVTPADMNG